MPETIKIIFAEDHVGYRKSMISALEKEGIRTIAEADNGKALLMALQVHKPDLVLLDLDMPEMNGSEAFGIIKQRYPDLKVIIYSSYGEGAIQNKFKEMGVNSFLTKNTDLDIIVQTIKKVHRSSGYDNIKAKSLFTKREIEIIPLILVGNTSKEIAQTLNISVKAIEATRNRLYEKTDTKNSSEFSAYCGKLGMNFLSKE